MAGPHLNIRYDIFCYKLGNGLTCDTWYHDAHSALILSMQCFQNTCEMSEWQDNSKHHFFFDQTRLNDKASYVILERP